MRVKRTKDAALRREVRESVFLLGLTALVSGTTLGIALLALWSLG